MNIIAVSGGTAPRDKAPVSGASLKSRVISALILAPFVVWVVYFGSLVYDLLILTAVVIMAWEWRRLCASQHFDAAGIIFSVAVAGATVLTSFHHVGLAVSSVIVSALIVLFLIARSEGKIVGLDNCRHNGHRVDRHFSHTYSEDRGRLVGRNMVFGSGMGN